MPDPLKPFRPAPPQPCVTEVSVSGEEPPADLSDEEIGKIHAGLVIPNRKAIIAMTREIRRQRGDKNPDEI